MNESESLVSRKAAHLQICLSENQYLVESGLTRLGEIRFIHQPAAELAYDDIQLHTRFLGKDVRYPFFISSMTGGSAGGNAMNRDLASAAELLGIPIGMGSIRVLFRKADVLEDFLLRRHAPTVPIFANLSIVQLREIPTNRIVELLKVLEVDGIAIHLNPAQELFQPEGDRDFTGIREALARFVEVCPVPVLVKETGCGIPSNTVDWLLDAGVSYVDLAGGGGTNWMRIEDYRHQARVTELVQDLDDWGIPLGLNLAGLFGTGAHRSDEVYSGKILASGGIRSPLDGAKCLAMGASLFGLALPVARAREKGGVDGIVDYFRDFEMGLRKVLLLAGAQSVSKLAGLPLVFSRDFAFEAEQYARG